ncbi:MAG: phage tail sheath C-terminal domain-containing protein, partial [Bacteroidota bacterium]
SSCAQRGDRFAILNTVAPSANASQDFQAFRTQTQGSNLSYGAVYYPWLSLSSGQSVPPAGAVAGLMAKTDRQKGVWKAPANVQIQGIAGPTHALSNGEQQIAQVHSSGKSINPFIQMTGRGSVIWGSRTLAGNDNEWRYVPVRRFLMMVEQSVEKGLNWAVFEPNNANTWAQIEALCEAYLDDLWRQGAMQGSRAEKAYYVRCGQGVTMTANDVQQGRMIIEIGMATVRPAEFVVMKIVLQNR